jgi:hypothetical protein
MFRSSSRRTRLLVALTLTVGLSWLGCTDESADLAGPSPEEQSAQFDRASAPGQEVAAAVRAQEAHTDRLMSMPGIEGTAVGLGADGRPEIQVYVERGDVAGVPRVLDGFPVKVHVTGKFRAMPPESRGNGQVSPRKKCPSPPCNGGGGDPGDPGDPGSGDNTDPTTRFVRPVPIGVSTGHPDITAGTIGACVTNGGSRYALSNNHVFANENAAKINDDILQPGSYDGGRSPADNLGTLSDFVEINFADRDNRVDAAIASVGSNIGNATPSNGYGVPKSTTADATIGMRVMKYGRTTGLTKGRVQGVNATINVGYDTGVARFTGQIVIGGGGFSAGGDSGSLIVVEKGSQAKQPVGLLFAGGAGTTIANPIGEVLAAFGVQINCQ